METTERPLQILSAFARDSLQGYIYIEAEKQAHVQQAIDKMINVYGSKLQLVPVAEMVDCLTIKKKDLDLRPGKWVRFKRGKYEGDLAQVAELSDTDDVVTIKIVPRVEYNKSQELGDKKRKKAMRPAPKFFSRDLVEE